MLLLKKTVSVLWPSQSRTSMLSRSVIGLILSNLDKALVGKSRYVFLSLPPKSGDKRCRSRWWWSNRKAILLFKQRYGSWKPEEKKGFTVPM